MHAWLLTSTLATLPSATVATPAHHRCGLSPPHLAGGFLLGALVLAASSAWSALAPNPRGALQAAILGGPSSRLMAPSPTGHLSVFTRRAGPSPVSAPQCRAVIQHRCSGEGWTRGGKGVRTSEQEEVCSAKAVRGSTQRVGGLGGSRSTSWLLLSVLLRCSCRQQQVCLPLAPDSSDSTLLLTCASGVWC